MNLASAATLSHRRKLGLQQHIVYTAAVVFPPSALELLNITLNNTEEGAGFVMESNRWWSGGKSQNKYADVCQRALR